MKKKSCLVVIVSFLLLVFLIPPANALDKKNAKKAKKFIKSEKYSQAIPLLKRVISDNPQDKEAYFQLGFCHINTENFKKAHEWFDKAFTLKPRFGKRIGEVYLTTAELIFKRSADFAVKKEKLLLAGDLFTKATVYDAKLKKHGYEFFLKLGNRANMTNGVVFYERALTYAKGDKERHHIGYKLLKVAAYKWPGQSCEDFKKKAADIIGKEKVSNVFPSPYMRSIFKETYTEADAKKDGNIYTFAWGSNIKKGDVLEVTGKIPGEKEFNAKEILIWKGKQYKPKWFKSENGYFRHVIENVRKEEKEAIWIEKNKGIKVKVKITRKIIPKPNYNLISEYTK